MDVTQTRMRQAFHKACTQLARQPHAEDGRVFVCHLPPLMINTIPLVQIRNKAITFNQEALTAFADKPADHKITFRKSRNGRALEAVSFEGDAPKQKSLLKRSFTITTRSQRRYAATDRFFKLFMKKAESMNEAKGGGYRLGNDLGPILAKVTAKQPWITKSDLGVLVGQMAIEAFVDTPVPDSTMSLLGKAGSPTPLDTYRHGDVVRNKGPVLAVNYQVEVALFESDGSAPKVIKEVKSSGPSGAETDSRNEASALNEAAAHRLAQGLQEDSYVLGFDGIVKSPDGKSRLVLDYARLGDSLNTIMKIDERLEGTPRVNAKMQMFVDMLRGVAQAHANGVMHLDIKYENFFINDDGRLLLSDFGTARTSLSKIMTPPQVAPIYGAPELEDFRKKHVITHKADMWSLGVILYQMFVRRDATGGAQDSSPLPNMPFPPNEFPGTVWKSIKAFAAKNEDDRFDHLGLRKNNAMHLLIGSLLHPDPNKRPNASEVLSNRLFAHLVNSQETDVKSATSKARTHIVEMATAALKATDTAASQKTGRKERRSKHKAVLPRSIDSVI
ncbi:MAG: hypothetical protein EOO22_02730 [Comamonadaceae bacterium]|nr:MAG: hypothetical protein EOO22_02730 [Comamonadaceae bacterium]